MSNQIGPWIEAFTISQWGCYGSVAVKAADGRNLRVCVFVGVPLELRNTAEEAGGDMVTPYLTARYVSDADWKGLESEEAEEILTDIVRERHWLYQKSLALKPGR